MLIFTVNTIAVAPYGLNGQNQSTTYPNVHQVPNKQVTNLGGINALIETGNNNLLENPSFEHATVQSGWTNSAGTIAAESSIVVHGKKSLKITLSSQTLDLSQNSTLYQAQFADGVQGLAAIKIKTSVAGLRVCAQKAGTINSNLCVSVKSDNKWGYYKVPFILGGTSNGIEIDSNGVAVTGDVYFDEAFVGAQELTQQINACESADCTTSFVAFVNSTGGVGSENYSSINGNCVNSSTGVYDCTYETNLFSQVPRVISNISSQLSGCRESRVSTTSLTGFTVQTFTSGGVLENCGFVVNILRIGSDYTSAIYKGVGNTYSSNNADTDWEDCQFSTLAWQGLGTITNENTKCRRNGSHLQIIGWVTIGTVSASEARMPLPIFNGIQLTTKNNTVLDSTSTFGIYVGSLIRSSTGGTTIKYFSVLAQASSQFLNFSPIDTTSTLNPVTPQTGSNLFSNNSTFEINASIPIEGWENSNVIIGQFNGLESCANTLECTDTFSAKVSNTGVVSEENVDWINGNCSFAGGNSNCTFNSSIFTVAPNCVSSSQVNRFTRSVSSSSSVTTTNYTDAGVADQQAYNLVCQKQGADYIGKTAKAVASDQNLRTPGVTKAVVYSAHISSTGSIVSEFGDFINGSCVVTSTNVFTCSFNSGVFASDPVCQVSVIGVSGTSRSIYIAGIPSSTSVSYLTFNTSGPTAVALNAQLTCHGISP